MKIRKPEEHKNNRPIISYSQRVNVYGKVVRKVLQRQNYFNETRASILDN